MATSWFLLLCQVVCYCCVHGDGNPWRLPVSHTLSPVIIKPTFQFTRSRITTPNRNYSSSIWPTPSPVPVKSSSIENVASKPYKIFKKIFYDDKDYGVKKTSTSVAPKGKIIFENRQDLESVRKANTHLLRVQHDIRCGVPKPKVIRVSHVYPDHGKEYFPRCTILHRCGDDTSCCDTLDMHCVPKMVQEVELYFYTLYTIKSGQTNGVNNAVEMLLFENHTACECVPINDTPRHLKSSHASPPPGHDLSWSSSNKHEAASCKGDHAETSSSTSSTTTGSSHSTEDNVYELPRPSSLAASKCGDCPVPFSRRDFSDGRCSCDCFDRHKPCLKVKRGREPLSEVERRCVEVAHCHIPECEFGQYSYDTGRCPRKPDNFRRPADDRGYPSLHHRENFIERD